MRMFAKVCIGVVLSFALMAAAPSRATVAEAHGCGSHHHSHYHSCWGHSHHHSCYSHHYSCRSHHHSHWHSRCCGW